MSTANREQIMARIAEARVPELQHPGRYQPAELPAVTIEEIVSASGADCREAAALSSLLPETSYYSLIPELTSSTNFRNAEMSVERLLSIHTTVCRAVFIVRENGAVWIDASALPVRAALFTCEHLIVLLPSAAVRETMTEAMLEIAKRGHGAGYFIAGPSKTADIEQCLVVGAQGARRVTIALER